MARLINFNKRVIDALAKPRSTTRDEYRDRKEDGLYLYHTPRGKKTFYLYKHFEGGPVRIKLGRYPDLSVSAARMQAKKFKGQMALGENPLQARRERSASRITLREVAESYLQSKKGKIQPSTELLYRSILAHGLRELVDKPVASVSKSQLVDLHRKLTVERGKTAADSAIRDFGKYFNFYADRYEYDGVSPVKTLSQNKLWNAGAGNRRQRYITDQHFPKWFKAVMQHDRLDERDYLLLLVMTGMRKTETEMMLWEDVDFTKRIFTVRETKNGDSHSLPMTGFLNEMLSARRQKRECRRVFPESKQFTPDAMAARLSKSSGIRFSLHDLRRTFATIADRIGLGDYTIKALLNHKSGADVTQGYIIREVEQLREPMERITAKVLELAGQTDRKTPSESAIADK